MEWDYRAFYDTSFRSTLIGIGLTIPAALFAIWGISRHTYIPADSMFPYASLIAEKFNAGYVVLACALIQFPVYGVLLGVARGWDRYHTGWIGLGLIHLLAIGVCICITSNW